MDDRRVADYFVVAGLPDNPQRLEDFSRDGAHLKSTHNQAPITDIGIFFPTLGESPPEDYISVIATPTGFPADLNHGSLRSPEVYLCFKRGRDKPPLVDIGIMYEGKERIMPDAEFVAFSTGGRPANVNNSGAKTYVTYRRALPTMPCNELVVTDICVILSNKGEVPPHAFCMINKNLNKGMVGSDVFLCYKKSMNRANLISYKPGILARYPLTDHECFPFPTSVPMFCLPMGSSIECWPASASQPRPVFSTFVLTVSDAAEKVYGSAVTFYERIDKSNLTPEQCKELQVDVSTDAQTVNVNKCICLLSHWPFFDTFDKFLLFLYKMSCEGPHLVPIERYISHFLEDVPFPSSQRPRILVQLSAQEHVVLTQPEDLPLPRSGAGFRDLLLNLGPDNCLLVLLLALTEQKLLIHSLRPDVLTAVAEAVSMIIFPFKWQCPYIPLCPLGLAEVLHAPLPFLIGVDSRFFDLYDPPADVSCVDLDTNTISVCEDRRSLNAKLLPKKPARILRNTLERLYQKMRQLSHSINQEPSKDSIDRDFLIRRKELALELEIQEAFLRFMAVVLKGYRICLLPITKAPTVGTTDTNSLFDLQERSFVSDMDASLAFFDECTEKVDVDDGEVHLIELDESHQSERTVFIMPPEPTSQGSSFKYKVDFRLNPLLLSNREVKGLLVGSGVAARLSGGGCLPSSPMARRTKHEIKSAQKFARKQATNSHMWAKCLLGTCYSLWFIHLPSYTRWLPRNKVPLHLRAAYHLLVRMNKLRLRPTDEVCYRVVMQLCGQHSQPVLAVKLLSHMKKSGVQPNAITYGHYNRAVLEATWPSDGTTSSQLLWNKLRNVILGAALFKRGGMRRRLQEESFSVDGIDGVSRTSVDSSNSHESSAVHVSHEPGEVRPKFGCGGEADTGYSSSASVGAKEAPLDAEPAPPDPPDPSEQEGSENRRFHATDPDFAAFDRIRSRVGSIVRPCGTPLLGPIESSAGLLMTGNNCLSGGGIGEELDHFDCEGGGDATPGCSVPPVNHRARNRSGSCSEFMFPRSGPTSPASPKPSPHSPDVTNRPPTNWKLLTRSESFANDAPILRLGLHGEGRHSSAMPLSKPLSKGSARSLFGRRGSFTLRRQSRESSTENLEERSSAGSADDLDSVGSATPRHLASKLYSWGSRFLGSEVVGMHKNSADSLLDASSRGGSDLELAGRQPLADTLVRTQSSPLSLDPDKIDIVQEQNNEQAESLCGSPTKTVGSPSQKTSPIRTPVTENDPLGALDGDGEDEQEQDVNGDHHSSSTSLSSSVTPAAEGPGGPILFGGRGRGVSRSATFSHQGDGEEELEEEEEVAGSTSMQRSSTMPVDMPASTSPTGGMSSGLSSLGSSFKLPFSPSSLTSKKSNELLMGGLSSLKSAASTAASTMYKKFDEIKEAISANSTPVKGGSGTRLSCERDGYDDDGLGSSMAAVGEVNSVPLSTAAGEERRRVSSEFSSLAVQQQLDTWGSNIMELFGNEGTRKGSASNLMQQGTPGSVPLLQQQQQQNLHLQQIQQQLYLENLYPKDLATRDPRSPVAMEISMTTCSKCHNCLSVLYDEEIMAGWKPEDSNLNTKCQFCEKDTVPLLTVRVLDLRSRPYVPPAPSLDCGSRTRTSLTQLSGLGVSSMSVDSGSAAEGESLAGGDSSGSKEQLPGEAEVGEGDAEAEPIALEAMSVPYLNPLVLRKELENILQHEGDSCLTQPKFVDEHPIIYWNMVWFFQRIGVASHLPGLCLQSKLVNRVNDDGSGSHLHPSWVKKGGDYNNVVVRCLWDNLQLHEEVGQPMYMLWSQKDLHSSLVSALITDVNTIPRSIMDKVIRGVRDNDLSKPLKRLAAERQALRRRGVNRSHSLYRDMLFLSFTMFLTENMTWHLGSFFPKKEKCVNLMIELHLKGHFSADIISESWNCEGWPSQLPGAHDARTCEPVRLVSPSQLRCATPCSCQQ
ncbi:Uncharacterized protein GBIM_05925 [Gryllus bimaculatus]|nr:Uncharacterized protein GBIM_05925 [Gryllus bimaculatus]